jgi:integrase
MNLVKAIEEFSSDIGKEKLADSTVVYIRSDLRVFLHYAQFNGIEVLGDLSPTVFEAFFREHVKSTSAARRYLYSLGKLSDMCLEKNYIKEHLLKGFDSKELLEAMFPEGESARIEALSPGEAGAFLEMAREQLRLIDPWAMIILGLLLTGLKTSEMLALVWENIRSIGQMLIIEAGKRKVPLSHRVPADEFQLALNIASRNAGKGDLVIGKSRSSLRLSVVAYGEAAGIQRKISLSGFRWRYMLDLVKSGHDADAIADRMGTKRKYVINSMPAVREALSSEGPEEFRLCAQSSTPYI